jgi:DNA-binding CsgD family transcriptional regulator
MLFDLPHGTIQAASAAAEAVLASPGRANASSLDGRRLVDLIAEPVSARRAWGLLLAGDIDGYWRTVRLCRDDGSTLQAEVWVSAAAPGRGLGVAVAVLAVPATAPASGAADRPAGDSVHLIGVVSDTWEVSQISSTVTDLLGHSAEDIVGRSLLEFVHPSEVPQLIMTLGAAAGPSHMSQMRLRIRISSGGWEQHRTHLTHLAGANLPSFAFMARPELAVPDDGASRLLRLARELRPHDGTTDRSGLDRELRSLSRRESEIVALLLEGERAPDIARTLVLSQSTVRNHLASAFKKIGVHSQQELVRRLRGNLP